MCVYLLQPRSAPLHGTDVAPSALLRAQIRAARPALLNRRVRLIHSGRMLTDGTFLFGWLASLEERQQRAKAQEAGPPPARGGAPTPTTTAPSPPPDAVGTTWIHCSVGPVMDAGEMEDDTAEQVRVLAGWNLSLPCAALTHPISLTSLVDWSTATCAGV